MRRPTKLQLHLLKLVKGESLARARSRVRGEIRDYNNNGIRTNWLYQAEAKL
jgi:hypothetical protein